MKRAILQVADTLYKPIPGFPSHRVGSDGSIWTCSKFGPRGPAPPGSWRRMKPVPDKDGYLRVTLCRGGVTSPPIGVHVYVLLTFVGPCPEGMEACHNDGNPGNNRINNLRWDTPSRNNQDKWLHGTQQTGEVNGNSKLTEAEVRVIREMGRRYGGKAKAARIFKVHRDTVEKICKREIWGWLS